MPTGKARVQMQKRANNAQAYTLAQFLLALGRIRSTDRQLSRYRSREPRTRLQDCDHRRVLDADRGPIGATLDAIETTAVERLILVGDPRQLPPIGAGRPFVDVVRHLNDDNAVVAGKAPPGYAELKIVRRQTEQSVAAGEPPAGPRRHHPVRWFGGEAPDPGADEAWDRLTSGKSIGIRAVRWEGDTDLQAKLLDEIKAATRAIAHSQGFDDERDDAAFEISLGGRPFKEVVYFNLSRPEKTPRASNAVVVGAPTLKHGHLICARWRNRCGRLESWLQKSFRRQARAWAEPEKYWERKACKPLGAQRVLYGDKVIWTCPGFVEG